ncbi:MAG: glucosaminidase domain-containing protein, partial [Actinomycetota bacterium]
SVPPSSVPPSEPGVPSPSVPDPDGAGRVGGAVPPSRPKPPPISPVQLDLASIQQLTVEARRFAELARDADLAAALAATEAARGERATAQADLDSASALAETAAAITAERRQVTESARQRIAGIAADAYMRVGTDRDDVLSRLRIGSGGTDPGYVDAQQTKVFADQALAATRTDLQQGERDLAAAVEEQEQADRSVTDRTALVEQRTAVVAALEAAEVVIRNRPIEAQVTANVASLLEATGPTLLGESLVGAEDLAAFVRARGRPHPSVNVEELAMFFLDEGGAEGIRADLAWVQSILETGWFSFANSMVYPADHNYAGVGACDSCSRGFIFDTPQLGARAQMQLLKAYADPTTTAASLARPSVLRPPERLSVRGCCATWMALAGVWATNQEYGVKILTLYDDLLRFSAQRQASAAAAGPSTVVPPPG